MADPQNGFPETSMLIDSWLPKYDYRSEHKILVHAAPEETYRALMQADLRESFLIRLLFGLRGLSFSLSSKQLRLMDMNRTGFMLLDESPAVEIVLGLIGKFWTLQGGIRRMEASGFRDFSETGFARVAWNFFLSADAQGTVLSTETRIECIGDDARRPFSRYWGLVGPFSGLTRKAMLKIVKRSAESSSNIPGK